MDMSTSEIKDKRPEDQSDRSVHYKQWFSLNYKEMISENVNANKIKVMSCDYITFLCLTIFGLFCRYKALDRIDQDRKLMLFQHLGFVHCPIREHCPAFPNCMDALIERILRTRAHRYDDIEWKHNVLVIIGMME
jgi:hypothetical protein